MDSNRTRNANVKHFFLREGKNPFITHIFLATEDSIYENAFKQKYGDLLCTIQEEKILYTGGYLSDIIRLQTKQERMQTAINYLKKILVLSKCQCFVAGRTSGTVGVMLQDHQFDCTFFFDHGRY